MTDLLAADVADPPRQLVALYLYDDEGGGVMPPHPSARTASLVRYLECAVTQAASLHLAGADCEVLLVTNLDRSRLSVRERELLDCLPALGVELRATEFDHGGGVEHASWHCLRDAVLAACEDQPQERTVWLPNLDSVFVNPSRVFAAAPPRGELGALFIPYEPHWEVGGTDAVVLGRLALGVLAGIPEGEPAPPWVGADLLCGTPAALRGLVERCDAAREQFAAEGHRPGAEHLLGLVAARGEVQFRDLSAVAERIQTGARHEQPPPVGALSLGLWHLPAEKGLSLRRAAAAVRRGRTARLRADLADPSRAATRFNVGPARTARRLRDDTWLAFQKLLLHPRVGPLVTRARSRTRAGGGAALLALLCAASLGACGDAPVGHARTTAGAHGGGSATGTTSTSTTTTTATTTATATTGTATIPGTSVRAGASPGNGLPGATAQVAPKSDAKVAKIDAGTDKVLAEGKVHIASGAPSDSEVRKEIELAQKAGIKLPKGDTAQSFENSPSNAAGGAIQAEIPVTVWNPRSKPIATWIIPILQWAHEHGWHGTVTSGYRTFYEQAQLNAAGLFSAPAGFSNHEKTIYPGGAVDVTDPGQLIGVLKGYRGPVTLVGGVLGAVDPEHFSATGD